MASLALLVRLPILYNADPLFNADEAVNALVIKHLVEGRSFSLYNWDTRYFGIVEGLIAIPFIAVLGFHPLAFKLAAVTGHLALMVGVFFLGRHIYDETTALMGVALLIVFSPQVVQWSTLASGGFLLIVAWGTLTVLFCLHDQERATSRSAALFGFATGFGLYIYELFLVYLPPLVLAALSGSRPWQRLRTNPAGLSAGAPVSTPPSAVRRAMVFMVAFVAGCSPRLATLLTADLGGRQKSYGLASPREILENLKLLIGECLPALLGVNPASNPNAGRTVGPGWPGSSAVGLGVAVLFAAALAVAAWHRRRELLAILRFRPVRLSGETVLVLLVPSVLLIFVVSKNPYNVLSNRYLLPLLTALPLLGASLVRRVGRFRNPWCRPIAAGLLAVLLLFPATQTYRYFVARGLVSTDLRLLALADPKADVLDYLRSEGIRFGYADYWLAYELTMRSDERFMAVPFRDWDRYPPYRDAVGSAPSPAYVFYAHDRRRLWLEHRLTTSGTRYDRRQFGRIVVFSSPSEKPLLPPDVPHTLRSD